MSRLVQFNIIWVYGHMNKIAQNCVKSVRIRTFSSPNVPAFGPNTPYLSIFNPNAGKYGPEKLRIRMLFTQCKFCELVIMT